MSEETPRKSASPTNTPPPQSFQETNFFAQPASSARSSSRSPAVFSSATNRNERLIPYEGLWRQQSSSRKGDSRDRVRGNSYKDGALWTGSITLALLEPRGEKLAGFKLAETAAAHGSSDSKRILATATILFEPKKTDVSPLTRRGGNKDPYYFSISVPFGQRQS